ncbi:MAG: hypothetical protein LQ340_005325 [Diploschistes diacapsis]|nr:MAG: hypothetical protein LQ340_005325 [Diploschistes diacapsis]
MVFLAEDMKTDELVAIKCLTKQSTTSPCPDSATNDHLIELLCHDRLGYHPNIVNLLHGFETDAHMFLVLEFCSMGDLYEAIRMGRGPLETEHVRAFMLELIDAVEFMHAKGLYHRDIKPENIFLDADGSMKLGDFGLSTTETWTYEACVGSDRYMAPEQYDPSDVGYSPAQADIWSIGICLLNILFSRNPFVTPTESDVLYADFVRDRESLFDVFPSLSQDAFDVLIHALAVDPTKRSLSAVRAALERVTTFTSDDDVLDEFCTEGREVVPATANRQPFRTPSIQSPPVDQGGAFPWSKVLHMTSPRQLSVIHDDELFPEHPAAAWSSNQADAFSIGSLLDSTLGASIKSMNLREPKARDPPRAEPAPISESVPTAGSKAIKSMSTIFGKKDSTMSKSWSDLWDEDEEEEGEELDARRRYNARNWSSESVDQDVTIGRRGLSEITNTAAANSRTQSPPAQAEFCVFGDSTEDVASIDLHPQPSPKTSVYSPPAKRSVMDKWAALGNRRRAATTEPLDKSTGSAAAGAKSVSGGTWRHGFGLKAFSGNKDFTFGDGVNLSSGKGLGFAGWKHRGEDKAGKEIPGAVKIRDWRRDNHHVHRYHHGHAEDDDFDSLDIIDNGDVEWVGGWKNSQL